MKNVDLDVRPQNKHSLIRYICGYRSFCKHDSDALEHTMIERVDRLHRYIPLLTVK